MPRKRHETEGTSEEGGELYTGYLIRVGVAESTNDLEPRGNRLKHVRNAGIIFLVMLLSFQSGFSLVDTAILSLSVGLVIYLFSYN